MATPNNKTPLKSGMQTRALTMAAIPRKEKRLDSNYYVEGYAALYEPYPLFELEDGTTIYEQFERGCFANTDMSDVIFQLNHQGTVHARMSNGTLIVEPDDHGLFTAADLSKTSRARDMYEDISSGMITKMSWGFIPGEWEYKPEIRTIVHHSVKKIFDVSAVSLPANENTNINARDFVHGVMDEVARREAELENIRRKLRIKMKLLEV